MYVKCRVEQPPLQQKRITMSTSRSPDNSPIIQTKSVQIYSEISARKLFSFRFFHLF